MALGAAQDDTSFSCRHISHSLLHDALILLQLNEPVSYLLEGELDLAVLERAANLLLDRHEVLRCCFTLVDGRVMMEVHPEARVPLAVIKVRLLSGVHIQYV